MRKNGLLGVMIVLGVWCLLYVGIKIDMWRLGYDMEDLEHRRIVLKKQQEMLQVRLSKLTDPQQVARRAKDELQLIVPREGQVVMISLDTDSSPESDNGSPFRLVREFSSTFMSLP